MSFIEVPAQDIRTLLIGAGFIQSKQPSGQEETWELKHLKNSKYKIIVYTSIQIGESSVRDCGSDAIRVVVTYSAMINHEKGVWKSKRVNRAGTVEGVCSRLLERMREAYGWINQELKK